MLSNPDVDSAVITMNSVEKIDEYLGASGWEKLAYGDMDLLERYAHLNKETYCNNVCKRLRRSLPVRRADPGGIAHTRMYAVDYQDVDFARREYGMLKTNAAACLSCDGQPCANACTHGIAIDRFCGPTHSLLA